MTTASLITFMSIMLTLAILPSASVALVVARSATCGFMHGLAVTAGIVIADLVFATLAIAGMTAFAQSAGLYGVILRYVAGAYMIYFGIGLIRSGNSSSRDTIDSGPSSLSASFLAGLFLTFGDMKAIFFYASLFPTLFDLHVFTSGDYAVVISMTVFIVGSVKLVYAGLARSIATRYSGSRITKPAKFMAGMLIIGAGVSVIAKA